MRKQTIIELIERLADIQVQAVIADTYKDDDEPPTANQVDTFRNLACAAVARQLGQHSVDIKQRAIIVTIPGKHVIITTDHSNYTALCAFFRLTPQNPGQ